MGAGVMITVLDLLAQRNANINASTQLVNLSDNAEGGSRCGDTDAFPSLHTSWKQMLHMSLLVKCGTVAQWVVIAMI